MRGLIFGCLLALCAMSPSAAATINVAVAANFTLPAEEIVEAFQVTTGDIVKLSFGSTGALYAQISQGAPFDAFLSADTVRAQMAVDEGLAVPDSYFVYAVGQLALYGPLEAKVDEAALRAQLYQKLAIADPHNAPYGAAAIETLTALKLLDDVQARLVMGSNVTQTLQFIETGNAEMGFVALSQVIAAPQSQVWIVPDNLHAPIAQAGVQLKASKEPALAAAFLKFLRGPQAAKIITASGYGFVDGAKQ